VRNGCTVINVNANDLTPIYTGLFRTILVEIIRNIEHCVGGIPIAVRVGSERKASEYLLRHNV
jgi:hypothetical protein